MSITPEPEPGNKPDVLRELYQQAVADDRGPSAQSSDAAPIGRASWSAGAESPAAAHHPPRNRGAGRRQGVPSSAAHGF